MDASQLWSIVLAGGDGRRLDGLSVDPEGRPIPKQYWRMDGGRSLLCRTLERFATLVPPSRTVPVVAASHGQWWNPELAFLPRRNLVVQPSNRGTAAGILLPLLQILEQDRDGLIVILPSDHWVDDQPTLLRAVSRAVSHVQRHQRSIVLLGMEADPTDADYGWIVPHAPNQDTIRPVMEFVEKPIAAVVPDLVSRGSRINSMILVARATSLLNLFCLSVPHLVDVLLDAQTDWSESTLAEVYEFLPNVDFSRHVLQPAPDLLSVLDVPPCGWSDVGTPERVQRLLARKETHGGRERAREHSASSTGRAAARWTPGSHHVRRHADSGRP